MKLRDELILKMDTVYYRQNDLEPIETAIVQFIKHHPYYQAEADSIRASCKMQEIETCGQFRAKILGSIPSPSDSRSELNYLENMMPAALQNTSSARSSFPDEFLRYMTVDPVLIEYYTFQWLPYVKRIIRD